MAKEKTAAPAEPQYIYCPNCSQRNLVQTDKDTVCSNPKCQLSLAKFDPSAASSDEE